MREKGEDLMLKITECIHACNHCFVSCLNEEDVKMMKDCIILDKDCVAICQATLGLIYRGGHFVKEALSLCEDACKACADECRKHPYDHCKECARACDACAEACRTFM